MKNISFAFIQQWFKGLFNLNRKPEVQGSDIVLLKRKGQIISAPIDTLLEGYTSDEELQLSVGQLSATLSRLNTIYASTVGVTKENFILAANSNSSAIRLTPSITGKRIIPVYVHLSFTATDLNFSHAGGNHYYVIGTQPNNSGADYIFYLPQNALTISNGEINTRFIDGAGLNSNPLSSALFLYGTNNNNTSGFNPSATGTMSNIFITTYYTIHG